MVSLNDVMAEFFAPESSVSMTLADRDYILTTDHPASSYGCPVLVDRASNAFYGAADVLPTGLRAADAVRSQGQYGALELVPRFLRVVGLEPIQTVDGRLNGAE
jgi:hypothetical protein